MKLADIFRDGMVLQHGKPIRVYGEGEGEITAAFAGVKKTVTAENGRWCVEFAPYDCGGPYALNVEQNGERITLRDIWVGEVILCAGQSNMQVTMNSEVTPPEEYVTDPMLRMFVSSWSRGGALIRADDGWVKCEKESVNKWSALAYLTGLAIRRELKCAVGVVVCALGTSIIQAWMHEDRYFGSEIELPPEKMRHNIEKPQKEWNVPGCLYHDMFERLAPYSFAAAVWYQGESNTSDAEAAIYDKMLDVLVKNWREALRDEALPFTVVQLANYTKIAQQEAWAGVQAAQLRAAEWIPALTCVKCADICEDDNIHPPTKWRLARRIYEDLQAKHAIGAPRKLLLGEIFRDGMVLQRNKPIRVFGEAYGEVTVEFLGETRTVCADGRFDVEFLACPCGGPYYLKAHCGAVTVIVRDVMVGEVILCSGQSNMQFRVGEGTPSPEPFVSDGMLRIFVSGRPEKGEPITPADGWVKASPVSAPKWSALAYYWGVEARKELDCAVGMIVCSQGGSMVQAWTDEARFVGEDAPLAEHTGNPVNYTWNFAGELYHHMFEPLIPYSVGCVIWYQGENNGRAVECDNYRRMLEIMIKNWRQVLRDGTLPFAVVVLPDYTKHGNVVWWDSVRAGQRDAAKTVPGVIAVESADLCEGDNIHPPTKWRLAARLWEKMRAAGMVGETK